MKKVLSLLIFALMGVSVLWGQATPDSKPQYLQTGISAAGLSQNPRTMPRSIRYLPVGDAFVLQQDVEPRRFNRALYGNNEPFRLETGDTPEFGLYGKKGMMGNVKIVLQIDGKCLMLDELQGKEVLYKAGQRIYRYRDQRLGRDASLTLTAMAAYDCQGALFQVETENVAADVTFSVVFGGVRCKKFSRNGDLNVDPEDAFALHVDYCLNNSYKLLDNVFVACNNDSKEVYGLFPSSAECRLGNAVEKASSSELIAGRMDGAFPTAISSWKLRGKGTELFAFVLEDDRFYEDDYDPYFGDAKAEVKTGNKSKVSMETEGLPFKDTQVFMEHSWHNALTQIAEVCSHLTIQTPDPFINAAASALTMAADGIWESPVYQHGAIGWRVPLAGWRAAYTGDFLGWHDRARTHFSAYAASQSHVPQTKPALADTAMNLARPTKEWGRPMYSDGYIARLPNDPGKINHYDMNLCYIDELFWHLRWTGDTVYAREVWPVIKAHLAWEKRCFDTDDDGLYDAVAAIWASDAMQYSGGGVTHSSAYNYIANVQAAGLAEILGEDATAYRQEAKKIYKAVKSGLWIDKDGYWAEYQDVLGNKLLHPSSGVYTVYHAIDSRMAADAAMAYQATRYLDEEIPHISVKIQESDLQAALAGGYPLKDDYQTVSTSSWMPYYWSINNVAHAEVMHTALSYFQAGRGEAAFRLMKSALLDGMYLGASPGNVGQISFYDAARGEMYRDFADPVGVYSRAFVEGLFGIEPDLMHGKFTVRPSLPASWNDARISLSDVEVTFKRDENKVEHWIVDSRFAGRPSLSLKVPVYAEKLLSVKVNGEEVLGGQRCQTAEGSVGYPLLVIDCGKAEHYEISVVSSEESLPHLKVYTEEQPSAAEPIQVTVGQKLTIAAPKDVNVNGVHDPQHVLASTELNGIMQEDGCVLTLSDQIGTKKWMQRDKGTFHTFFLCLDNGQLDWMQPVDIEVQTEYKVHDFQLPAATEKQIEVDLTPYYNDCVNDIFTPGKYVSPRAASTTMQLPWQGFGDWCGPKAMPLAVDDSGWRAMADEKGVVHTSVGLNFATPKTGNNAVFVSQWDNYPTKIEMPLKGKASHAYLMMAGTTNHMQYGLPNGLVRFQYTDGTCDSLPLVHPDTWAPIEQAFYLDGMAYKIAAPSLYRVQLSTGVISRSPYTDFHLNDRVPEVISNPSMCRIPGGAAILLDLPLNPRKRLKSIELEAITIESVIGLMSLTLVQ